MATSNVPSNSSGATENSPTQAWDAEQAALQQSMKAKNAADISRAAAAARAAEASINYFDGMPLFTINAHGIPALAGPSKSTPNRQPRKRGR